jgi:hypothetical protein
MRTDSTYVPASETMPAPEELDNHLSKHWNGLDRVSVCRKIGHSIRKITAIHIDDDDDTIEELIELIMDITAGCQETEGTQSYRINCYQKNGKDQPKQSRCDFTLVNQEITIEKMPNMPELLLAQVNAQNAQNRMLIKEMIKQNTTITKVQGEIIEHLAGKFVEGLQHQENALQIQLNAQREERIAKEQAKTSDNLGKIVEGVLPIIGGKAAVGLKSIGAQMPTISEAWKSIAETLTPAQGKDIEEKCEAEIAGRIADLIGKTSAEHEPEICEQIQALMVDPSRLAPLQGILSLQQAAGLQTLLVRIREQADRS